jgi:hypothetical protein
MPRALQLASNCWLLPRQSTVTNDLSSASLRFEPSREGRRRLQLVVLGTLAAGAVNRGTIGRIDRRCLRCSERAGPQAVEGLASGSERARPSRQ